MPSYSTPVSRVSCALFRRIWRAFLSSCLLSGAPAYRHSLRRASLKLAILSFALHSTSLSIHAQTWNGAGANDLWSNGNNWVGGVAPVNVGTAAVAFGGSTRLTPDMDANWNILSLTFNSGAGAFTLGSTGSFTLTIQTGGITNSSSSTETINNAITLGAAQTWSAASGNLVFGGNVANGGFLLTIGGSSNTSASGIISGTGGLTKSGTGKLTLTGADSYSGATTISAGCLNIQNATGLGTTAAGTTVSSGATLQLQGGITVGTETLNINGTGASGQNGALVNVSGTNNYGGLLTLAGATTFSSDSGTLNLTNTGTITGATFGLTLTGAGNGSISSIIGTTSGTLAKSGSGTWTLTGANTYTGATTISAGALNIQNASGLGTTAGGTTVSSGAALQIQGGIAVGAEALTLNGSGVSNDGAIRNISGSNSMSGSVTLGSATTIASDAGTLTLSGAVTNGGFLLTETGPGNITLSGVVSGTGGLTMNGSGTLTLSGASANTFSGTTTVNAGVLALNKTAAINAIAGALVIGDNVSAAGTATVQDLLANQLNGATSVTVNPSGVLDLNGLADKITSLTLESGDIAGASVTTGTAALKLNSNLTLAVQGTGAVGATISGNVSDGGAARTITVNDGNANADLTISAVMQGSKGYTKDGAGRLVLSGANTDSGTFTINAGPVQIQNASALSANSAVTVNSGGALELVGGLGFSALALTLNGTGVSGTGALLNVSGNNSLAAPITLGSDSEIDSASGTLTQTGTIANGGFLLTVGGAGNVTASGIISGTGGLTKDDSGTVTLSGGSANTYSGATTVKDGELDLNKTAGVNAFAGTLTVGDGTGAASSAVARLLASNQIPGVAVTVNNDGLLDLNNFSDTIGALNMTGGDVTTGTGILTLGGTVTGNAAASSATITGNLALGAARIFTIADGAAAVDMNVSAIVSGAFTLTKNGTGTMVLSGANTYTGATTVSAGVLNIQNDTGLGTTVAGTTVSSGATLQLQGGITVGAAETLNINGAGASGQTGALVNVSGTNYYGGLLTLAGATTLSSDAGTLSVTNAGTITGATFGLTLAGAGNGSISSIIGTTSGTLTKNGAGTWTLTGVNTYTSGTTINGGTLVVNSASSLGATSGGLTINAGTLEVATGYSTTRAITLGDAASIFQVDPSQTFTDTTAISGTGSLNKTGAGTMVLGATETYTGSTNVSAGTLQINASNRIVDTSALTVSGGTFDVQTFSETVAGVTLSGGSITGSGAGTLTGSTYTLQSGSASAILAGSGAVTKNTSGTVTLSGANTLSGAVTVSAGTLTLAASSGSALGSASSITVNSGGTLMLNANDQINNSATMSLGGGTFAKGNFSEGTTSAIGLGALTLTAGSNIDFGTGTVGTLTFTSLNASTFTLTIDNWTGNYNTVGSGSTDRLIFDSDQSSNLNSFFFTGYGAGGVEFNLGGGYWEVVAAVPEPTTYLGGALALGALAFHCFRRRIFCRKAAA